MDMIYVFMPFFFFFCSTQHFPFCHFHSWHCLKWFGRELEKASGPQKISLVTIVRCSGLHTSLCKYIYLQNIMIVQYSWTFKNKFKCSPPRVILTSIHVTGNGQFAENLVYTFTISSQTIPQLGLVQANGSSRPCLNREASLLISLLISKHRAS